ncbi:MAG: beta-lactamase family protein, partial [Saprospiraceae bacterium]|nr:beta-lactamase family protein [Saprospiraceae bacterium]
MKRLPHLLSCYVLTLFTLIPCWSQMTGRWNGVLEAPGLSLEMSMELSKEGDGWSGTLTIPVQMIQDMILSDLQIDKQSISFQLPEVPGNAHYEGQFMADTQRLAGTFHQAGQSLKLDFLKEDLQQKENLAAAISQFQILVDSLMLKRKLPGLGIGIVKDGEMLLSRGFGYRDIAQEKKVDDRTLFAIGSTTKAMTAAGLAMLADEGILDWEVPVITYMPDFRLKDPFATKEMTALDLTTHRSGLPRHDLLWYGSGLNREELYERLQFLEPTKSFRTTFQYQNLMFMTAGILVERLSGKSWEDFTSERILDPLGMSRSNFSVRISEKEANAAVPYVVVAKDSLLAVPYRNLDAIGPAGSINSCVQDMMKWVKLNLKQGKVEGSELISKEQFKILHNPHMLMGSGLPIPKYPEYTPFTYGGGWVIYYNDGVKILQHGGGIDGFTALVHLLPSA